MIRALLMGVWGAVIALGSAYGVMMLNTPKSAVPSGKEAAMLEQIKLKPMSVPVLAEGKVQGYVVAQLQFTIDKSASAKLPEPLDSFLKDGAFRTLYARDLLDFRDLRRFDLDALAQSIAKAVNDSVRAPLVTSVLIEDINYISKDDIRGGRT